MSAVSVLSSKATRHANTGLVILFLSLGALSFAVLQSLVAPALPVIAGDLNTTAGDISWVLTAYLLAGVLDEFVVVGCEEQGQLKFHKCLMTGCRADESLSTGIELA